MTGISVPECPGAGDARAGAGDARPGRRGADAGLPRSCGPRRRARPGRRADTPWACGDRDPGTAPGGEPEDGRTAPRAPRRLRTSAVLLTLAALAYSLWLLPPMWTSGLSVRDAYVSELAATGRPTAAAARAGDVTFALLCLLACLAVLRPLPGTAPARRDGTDRVAGRDPGCGAAPARWDGAARPDHPSPGAGGPPQAGGWHALARCRRGWTRWGWWLWWGGLVVTATATLVDAAAPMDCALSLSSCQAQLAQHTSLRHHVHEAASIVVGAAWVAVHLGAFLATRGTPARGPWQVTRRLSPVVLAVTVVYSVLSGVLELVGRGAGVAQRVHLLVVLVWCLGVAADLYRQGRGRARPRSGPGTG